MSKRATNATERMARLYGRQAAIYDWTRWPLLFGYRRLLHALSARPGESILDVGCGTGRLLPALARAVGSDGRVVGVDCAEPMVRRARARCAGLANVRVEHEVAERAGGGGRSFDAIVFAYSLTLLPEWTSVLDRITPQLHAGGRLAVLDFDGHASRCVRWMFEAHGVELGTARRETLGRAFTQRHGESRAVYAGLWRYFTFIGTPNAR